MSIIIFFCLDSQYHLNILNSCFKTYIILSKDSDFYNRQLLTIVACPTFSGHSQYACPAGLHVLVNYCGLTILSCLEYVAIGPHVSNLIFTDIVSPPEMASEEGSILFLCINSSRISPSRKKEGKKKKRRKQCQRIPVKNHTYTFNAKIKMTCMFLLLFL